MSGSVNSFWILSRLERRIASTVFVEQFPRLSKITFGGKPSLSFKSAKSSSFVTTTKFFSFANSQIKSSDSSRKKENTCWESGKMSFSNTGKLGERLASKRSIFLCYKHCFVSVSRVRKTCKKIFFGKVWKIRKNLFMSHSGGHIFQNIIDCNSHSSNAGFAAAHLWIKSNVFSVINRFHKSRVFRILIYASEKAGYKLAANGPSGRITPAAQLARFSRVGVSIMALSKIAPPA